MLRHAVGEHCLPGTLLRCKLAYMLTPGTGLVSPHVNGFSACYFPSPIPPPFPPLFQASAAILLHALRAASCPVGPAPQRMAYLFANALASRLAGDGMQRYFKDVPSDPKTLEQALAHSVTHVPHAFFFGSCAVLSVIHVLASAQRSTVDLTLSLALHSAAIAAPKEHLHIIEMNMETSLGWLPQLFLHLASRPQGPPHSVHVTVLDVCPAALASMAENRRAQAGGVKERLAVKALTAGLERFECDVVFCFTDDLVQTLAGLRFSEERERKRREKGGGRVRGRGKSRRVDLGWYRPCNSTLEDGTDPAGSVVDVLAVCNMVKLQELPDEADGRPSKRDCMLAVR